MSAAVAALLARARREIDAGILPACQVALARRGELEVFEALGACTTDTRFAVFSCTKPLVSLAVCALMGERLLDVSLPVVEYVPEFGTNGKDVVTVEHVMLHTSGFPHAPLGPPDWWTREGRLARMARWRLNWEPGTRYEYHPSSAHWVLAEILERVAGADFRDVVEQRVTSPAGVGRVLGAPEADQGGVARIEERGEAPPAEELRAVFGIDELPVTEVTNEALLAFNDPRVRALGHPGGGAVMTAADLARLYQVLLHDPGGVWDPAVLADARSNVRNRLPDPLLHVPANRTLGFVVAGDDGLGYLRGFGRTVSAETFGHNGAMGQIAWADPASGLSFAYATNGLDNHVLRQYRRGTALSSLAACC